MLIRVKRKRNFLFQNILNTLWLRNGFSTQNSFLGLRFQKKLSWIDFSFNVLLSKIQNLNRFCYFQNMFISKYNLSSNDSITKLDFLLLFAYLLPTSVPFHYFSYRSWYLILKLSKKNNSSIISIKKKNVFQKDSIFFFHRFNCIFRLFATRFIMQI